MIARMGSMWLDITGEDAPPFKVELAGDEQVIGRSDQVDVQLPGQNVSRKHATLFPDPMGNWMIRDMESRNGTYVNGQRVLEKSLIAGDVCRIGPYRLKVRSDAPTDGLSTDTLPGGEVTIRDAAFASIQRLEEFGAPKIDATHHAILSEYDQTMLRIEDPHERLRQLCELVVQKAFHGRQSLALRLKRSDPGGSLQPLCEPQVSSDQWRDDAPHVSRTLLRAVLESGSPTMASNAPSSEGAVEMSVSINVDEMAAIACPIRDTEDYMDVLYVSFPAMYGTGEWLLLVSLAAKAYQQAEMNAQARRQALAQAAMEMELKKARGVQMSLVPREGASHDLAGVEVGILFTPCKWVGGDYVDVVRLPDGRALFVLADVSGKGMAAALVTTMLHTMVHTHARQGSDLPAMVQAMDEHLCEHLRPETFVTAVFAAIDLTTGEVETVNAGHPQGVIVNRDGSVRGVQSEIHLPLGIQYSLFGSAKDVIQPNELYCCYSDGLSEMQDANGDWLGTDTVEQEVSSHYQMIPDLPVTTLIEQLSSRFNQIEPEERAGDDRSLLIVKRVQ